MAIVKPARAYGKIKQNALGTTTDDLNLDTSVTGYRDFSLVYVNGDRLPYWLEDGTAWEWGVGTFVTGTPNTFTRDCAMDNSSSGSLLSIGNGNPCILSVGPTPLDVGWKGVVASSTGISVTGDTTDHPFAWSVISADTSDSLPGSAGTGSIDIPCWAAFVEYTLQYTFNAVGATYITANMYNDSSALDSTVTVTGSATGTSLIRTIRPIDDTNDQYFRAELETNATGGLTASASLQLRYWP